MVQLSPRSPATIDLGRARRRRTIIGLTPLIDVVFILLVFFMLASSFLDWRSIALDTPSAGGAGTPLEGTLMVVLATETVRLAGTDMSDAAFERRLEALLAEDKDRRIIVRPGSDVDMQRTITVLDLIAAAGGTNIGLSNPPSAAEGRQP
ncbi:MAG: biopolymer transporter ExbD [Alphaproteobacteria bacterium]|nr:biopolymer transporter ExbD [Alphaproteobacteria bacterium]